MDERDQINRRFEEKRSLVRIVPGPKGKDVPERLKDGVNEEGDKTAIRHQNRILDFERNTKVDGSFYQLPKVIQERVKT